MNKSNITLVTEFGVFHFLRLLRLNSIEELDSIIVTSGGREVSAFRMFCTYLIFFKLRFLHGVSLRFDFDVVLSSWIVFTKKGSRYDENYLSSYIVASKSSTSNLILFTNSSVNPDRVDQFFEMQEDELNSELLTRMNSYEDYNPHDKCLRTAVLTRSDYFNISYSNASDYVLFKLIKNNPRLKLIDKRLVLYRPYLNLNVFKAIETTEDCMYSCTNNSLSDYLCKSIYLRVQYLESNRLNSYMTLLQFSKFLFTYLNKQFPTALNRHYLSIILKQ